MVQRAEWEAARKHCLLHMHDGATAAAKQEQGRSTYRQRIETRTPSGNYRKSSSYTMVRRAKKDHNRKSNQWLQRLQGLEAMTRKQQSTSKPASTVATAVVSATLRHVEWWEPSCGIITGKMATTATRKFIWESSNSHSSNVQTEATINRRQWQWQWQQVVTAVEAWHSKQQRVMASSKNSGSITGKTAAAASSVSSGKISHQKSIKNSNNQPMTMAMAMAMPGKDRSTSNSSGSNSSGVAMAKVAAARAVAETRLRPQATAEASWKIRKLCNNQPVTVAILTEIASSNRWHW